ncbi:MAG: immunoglobulin domain-containing protein, partial [Puniceicoccales bacterium]|nr:immunoglobulin domain-containing protein [Puniceicoccales bacterium]
TAVSQIIAGCGHEDENGYLSYFDLGIAPFATLYSGSLATSLDEDGSFELSPVSLYSTYKYFFATEKVDVINSSWGGSNSETSSYNPKDDWMSAAVDGLVRANPKTTMVVAAGNSGKDGSNTTASPATAYNVIAVGALSEESDYDAVADFSSRAPSAFYNPQTGQTVAAARATVHIVAPGDSMWAAADTADPDLAQYLDPSQIGATDLYFTNLSGTSFAAPLVSGGATLLASASHYLEDAGVTWWSADARDARVIKAVLLNSARKIPGWNNGTTVRQNVAATRQIGSGVTTTEYFNNVQLTTQALDYASGAGALDLDAALDQYIGQTGWWVLDSVDDGSTYLYPEVITVHADDALTVTLTWFAETFSVNDVGTALSESDFAYSSLADLNLEVWSVNSSNQLSSLLAASRTLYDTVEHLYLDFDETVRVALRVTHEGMTYDLRAPADKTPSETFALAWNLTPLEPAEASVAAPAISPNGGTFTNSVTVTIGTTPGATTRYTLDESEVSASSPVYTTPFTLTASATVKARNYRDADGVASAQVSAIFEVRRDIVPAPVATPAIKPNGGQFTGAVTVSITNSDSDVLTRYTLDNADVTASSSTYTAPFTLSKSAVVKARSYRSADGTASAQVSASFEIQATPPPPAATAPVIISNPASQTIGEGGSVSFSVSATGTAPLAYQWYKDNVIQTGKISRQLVLSNVTGADAGGYTVTVTNVAGAATSAVATLTVTTPSPVVIAPAIVTQPASQTVKAGSNVTFTVAATGSAPLSYQWSKDGIALSGKNAGQLVLANVTAADEGVYSVTVSNAAGVAPSANAKLTVTTLPPPTAIPVITAQPASQTVNEGGLVVFAVTAAGAPPLSYQWYKNGSLLSGKTSSLLVLTNAVSADAGSYTVVVSSTAGSVTSAIATLTISRPSGVPGIKTQPLSQTVDAGSNVTFSVSATGPAPLSYKWYKDGVLLLGKLTSQLKLTSVTAADEGVYSVVVSNTAGAVTSADATLTVRNTDSKEPDDPGGTDDPGDNDGDPGGDDGNGGGEVVQPADPWMDYDHAALANKGVKFTAPQVPKGTKLKKGAKAVYQWFYTDAHGSTIAIPNSNKATYTAKGASNGKTPTYGSGSYSVTLTYILESGEAVVITQNDFDGKAGETSDGVVKLITAPKIARVGGFTSTQAPGMTKTGTPGGVVRGEAITFTVRLEETGPFETGPLTYVWLKNGKEVVKTTQETYAFTDSYTVQNVQAAAKYSVRIETLKDANGKPLSKVTSKAIALKLILPPTDAQITTKPVAAGKTLTLTAKAKGTSKLTYTWYKEGDSVPLQSGTKASYAIRNVAVSDAGTYRVVVTNAQTLSGGYKAEATATAVVLPASAKNMAQNREPAISDDWSEAVFSSDAAGLPVSGGAFGNAAWPVFAQGSAGGSASPGEILTNAVAPEILAPGTLLSFEGNEDALEILSATEIPGGTYTYERCDETTAKLSYRVEIQDGADVLVEEGVLLLTFEHQAGGSYTLTGEGISADGSFTLSPP